MKTDYFNVYASLTETQKLILDSTRDWITKFVKPKIEESFNSSKSMKVNRDFPTNISEKGLLIKPIQLNPCF